MPSLTPNAALALTLTSCGGGVGGGTPRQRRCRQLRRQHRDYGKYTSGRLGPGTFTVRASKSGYESTTQTILFLANKLLDFTVGKAISGITESTGPQSSLRQVSGPPWRLHAEVR